MHRITYEEARVDQGSRFFFACFWTISFGVESGIKLDDLKIQLYDHKIHFNFLQW